MKTSSIYHCITNKSHSEIGVMFTTWTLSYISYKSHEQPTFSDGFLWSNGGTTPCHWQCQLKNLNPVFTRPSAHGGQVSILPDAKNWALRSFSRATKTYQNTVVGKIQSSFSRWFFSFSTVLVETLESNQLPHRDKRWSMVTPSKCSRSIHQWSINQGFLV